MHGPFDGYDANNNLLCNFNIIAMFKLCFMFQVFIRVNYLFFVLREWV